MSISDAVKAMTQDDPLTPTAPLDEFIAAFEEDPNLWWRISTGHHLNLLEAAIDRISLERHELSRRAKDLGSAAVMVALGMCVMTWGLIVGPLVVHWIRTW